MMGNIEDGHVSEGLKSNFSSLANQKLTLREMFCRTVSFANAVRIDMEPPAEILEILKEHQNAGYENPMAFGGSLLDAYLRQKGITTPTSTGDIDIALSPADTKAYFDEHLDLSDPDCKFFLVNAGFASHTAEQIKNKIQGITATSLEKADTYKEFDACIEADYETQDGRTYKLDLCFTDSRYSIDDLALGGDAPINSIAMDADGNIYAHPNFEAHAKALLYSNIDHRNKFGNRAEERYQKTKARIPALINITDGANVIRSTVRQWTGAHI